MDALERRMDRMIDRLRSQDSIIADVEEALETLAAGYTITKKL